MLASFCKHLHVEDSCERGALSTRRDIGRPKIADYGHAELLGQVSRLADLESGRPGPRRIMENRLPVQTNKLRLAPRPTGMLGIETPQIVMQLGDFMTRSVVPGCSHKAGTKILGEGGRPMIHKLTSPGADPAERVVNTVQAGSGHDSQH